MKYISINIEVQHEDPQSHIKLVFIGSRLSCFGDADKMLLEHPLLSTFR